MKRFIRKVAARVVKFLFSKKALIPIGNKLFDESDFKKKDFILLNVTQPNFEFDWHITLLNGKKVHCTVKPDAPATWHYAVSYLWHDIGLSYLEYHLNKFYKKDRYYIDIGSNIGLRSIYYLSENRPGILFEPNRNVNMLSKATITKNNFKNYKIEEMGLSDVASSLTFYISSSGYMSSFDKKYAEPDGIVEEIEIPVTTLDNYLQNKSEVIPGIIKIDVEGLEYAVLKGAENTLRRHKPSLVIEILDGDTNRKEIVEFLLEIGYKSYYINNASDKILRAFSRYDDKPSHNYFFNADAELHEYLRQHQLISTAG